MPIEIIIYGLLLLMALVATIGIIVEWCRIAKEDREFARAVADAEEHDARRRGRWGDEDGDPWGATSAAGGAGSGVSTAAGGTSSPEGVGGGEGRTP